jgi:hypothetical protein
VASKLIKGFLNRNFRFFLVPGLIGRQGLALRQQLLKHRPLQLPRPMLISVGQRGASRSRGQTQMTQFPFTGSQASTDFTQGLGVSQLAKKHGDELAPTAEATSVTFRVVLAHR